MPERGTRGMGLIADAGEVSQSKRYRATSTLSHSYENISCSDDQSLLYVTSLPLFLVNADHVARGVGEKLNISLFVVTINYGGFQSGLLLVTGVSL